MRCRNLALALVPLALGSCELPDLGPFDNPYDPENPANRLLSAPSGLRAVVGETSIELNWDEVEGATGYVVFRGSRGGDQLRLASVGEPHYLDEGLAPGVVHGYVVVATDSAGGDGEAAEILGLVPGDYGIVVAEGAPVTASRKVSVRPIAPGSARVVSAAYGSTAEEALAAEPVPLDLSGTYILPAGEGPQAVYARLVTDAGAETGAVMDSIVLDQTARIEDIVFCVQPGGAGECDTLLTTASASAGDVVRFAVTTGERRFEGNVWIEIEDQVEDPIRLTDPDLDGVYEGELETRLTRIRVIAGAVTAFLVDAAGNEAPPARSPIPLTVTD